MNQNQKIEYQDLQAFGNFKDGLGKTLLVLTQ